VDSDADTWADFATCDGLEWAVAEDVDAAAATVAAVQSAMDARKVGAGDAPLALIIDEVQMLDPATMAMVRDIAKRGRKRRVHLILATQYVRADILDRTLTGQCGWRIAGRLQDHTASKLAIGVSGAELLCGAGDMLIAHGGKVTRVQAALGTGADFARLPQGAEDARPAPKPGDTPTAKHVRKDDAPRIAWAIEQAASGGAVPSATAIRNTLNIGTDAARRARDAARRIVAEQQTASESY
jgi:DNA segregation ATPase FtsK/SpoIIIE-like protein